KIKKNQKNKTVANIKLTGEKLEVIPKKSRTRKDCLISTYSINIVLEVLSTKIRQKHEAKWKNLETKKLKYHDFR
ncbi:hypothetical protein OFM21_32780, partial [Escherichia coli]|nr:hypothetical protein [Escherichia coli]